MTTARYLCIHGHFYQPPRENPWLEAVEFQDSAYPYHDWNERITAECYKTNTAARILDGDGRIVQLINNYARISFNFGPTLLKWLEDEEPAVHAAIVEADRQSQERFGGHGSAMAQAYNHLIMPLANERDRRTQIIWGIRDFEHRFGRAPEGMWLPETAADTATLDLLAEYGIKFTILAPNQAARVRRKSGGRWADVSGGRIDPTRAYSAVLPSGRDLALFFYDGPISQAVAFERLLDRGETFANRLASAFDDSRSWPELAHIATDGETYGHHHRYGEMALAYALDYIEANEIATLANYGQYLEQFPPDHEAEIHDNSSWSCVHGVERWRSDCGCNTGGRAGWNQAWRGPLREALDWLRDEVEPRYEQAAAGLLKDPWAARDAYIDVILDRSDERVDRFLAEQAARELDEAETVTVLKLMELQRHAMLMYTSCGWFFDELSGIETTQVIHYAGRVVQLARDLFPDDLEEGFLERLEGAESNLPDHANGRRIYERWVRPAAVGLREVAAHFAVNSLFETEGEPARVYAFEVAPEDHHQTDLGGARLVLGRAAIRSVITRESGTMSYGMLHFGGHNVAGGVRPYQGAESYAKMVEEMSAAFERQDFAEIIRLQDRHFEGSTYSLRSLFRDAQRRIVQYILDETVAGAESAYRQIYEEQLPMMGVLHDLDVPAPESLRVATELVLTADIRRALGEPNPDFAHIEGLLDRATAWRIELSQDLPYITEQALQRFAKGLAEEPRDLEAIERLRGAAHLAGHVGKEVDLWQAQNVVYDILHDPAFAEAEGGDAEDQQWHARMFELADELQLRVEAA